MRKGVTFLSCCEPIERRTTAPAPCGDPIRISELPVESFARIEDTNLLSLNHFNLLDY